MAQTQRRKSTKSKTASGQVKTGPEITKEQEPAGSTEQEDAKADILDPETLWPSEAQPVSVDIDELEKVFATLTEVTDRVSLMNSVYDSDLDQAFSDLDRFTNEIADWNYDDIPEESRSYFMSHLTFHREIIADIIQEARSLLYDERRPYLKKLVKYHKDYAAWLSKIERRYA